MSHINAEKEVRVTARERAHPALRTLARACIALARHEQSAGKPAGSDATRDIREEARHD